MCTLSTSLSRLSKAISVTENVLTILYTVYTEITYLYTCTLYMHCTQQTIHEGKTSNRCQKLSIPQGLNYYFNFLSHCICSQELAIHFV